MCVFSTFNAGVVPLPYYPGEKFSLTSSPVDFLPFLSFSGHHFYFAVKHDERANWEMNIPCDHWGSQDADGINPLHLFLLFLPFPPSVTHFERLFRVID